MRRAVGLVLVAGLAAGCGSSAGSKPARPVGPTPLTIRNAYTQQVKTASTLTGLTGTVSFTQREAGGTLQLTGRFVINVSDPARATSRLQLTQTSPDAGAKAEVRGIGADIYFKVAGQRWVHLSKTHPPANTTVAGEQFLAAILLGGVSPKQYSDLLKVNPLQAGPVTGTGAQAVYPFLGEAKLGYTDDESTTFLPDVTTQLTKQGLLDRVFQLRLDARARPVSLEQKLTAAAVGIDYSVKVTGYTAAPTPVPTG